MYTIGSHAICISLSTASLRVIQFIYSARLHRGDTTDCSMSVRLSVQSREQAVALHRTTCIQNPGYVRGQPVGLHVIHDRGFPAQLQNYKTTQLTDMKQFPRQTVS